MTSAIQLDRFSGSFILKTYPVVCLHSTKKQVNSTPKTFRVAVALSVFILFRYVLLTENHILPTLSSSLSTYNCLLFVCVVCIAPPCNYLTQFPEKMCECPVHTNFVREFRQKKIDYILWPDKTKGCLLGKLYFPGDATKKEEKTGGN